MKKPFLKNSQIIPRKKGEIHFGLETDKGLIHPYLDGYTILPNEHYEELKRGRCHIIGNVVLEDNAISGTGGIEFHEKPEERE